MKLLVDVAGSQSSLDIQLPFETTAYRLEGGIENSGTASINEIAPGVFSVILGVQSFTVRIEQSEDRYEVWTGNRRHVVRLSDIRDRAVYAKGAAAAGPQELRAQMPGKIVRVLADVGTEVEAGEGLLVIEAMKMQNELKSPKAGRVAKVFVSEGNAVSAGDSLMFIE